MLTIKRANQIFRKVKFKEPVLRILNDLSGTPIKDSALRFFRELSAKLKPNFIVSEPRPTNYFKAVELVD